MTTTGHVAVRGLGSYSPERWVPAAEIAGWAGLTEEKVRDSYGVHGKHIAGPDEHVSDMAAAAGRAALASAGVEPGEIGTVVYFGSTWKDYPVWQAAPRIAHLLGCDQAYALELDYISCGAPVALRVCRALLLAEPDSGPLLAVGASRESDLVDYHDRWSQFMLPYGDGASAAVLEFSSGRPDVELLGSHIITDGTFANDTLVPAGGSVRPASRESVDEGAHLLRVVNASSMAGLLMMTLTRMREAAEKAAAASGIETGDIAFVCAFHLKPKAHEALLESLGVPVERSEYLSDTGHMSGVDTIFALDRAARAGRLNPGEHVLLIASGTGCSWAASIVRWGLADDLSAAGNEQEG